MPYVQPRQNGNGTYIYADGTTADANTSTQYTDIVFEGRGYGPRTNQSGVDNTINIAVDQTITTGSAPILGTLPYTAPVNGQAYINVTYRPDYFLKAAAAYTADTDRAGWLTDQLTKLTESWNQYTQALSQIQTQAATLDGKSNAATWASALGGIAIATGNPYAIGAGAVLTAGALVLKWIETRKDKAALTTLQARANILTTEAAQISALHEQYTKELNGIRNRPLFLAAGAAILYYLN